MPRPPAVDHEKTIAAFLEFPGLVANDGSVVGLAQPIWKEVAAKLENKLQPGYLHLFFYENRHGSQDLYREKYDIRQVQKNRATSSTSASSDEETDDYDGTSSDKFTRKEYLISIDYKTWEKYFKPIIKTFRRKNGSWRSAPVMPPFKWEDKLVELIWCNHKLPCAYAFQHSYVYTSEDPEKYISIEATCNECKAKASGVVLKEPEKGENAEVRWKAPDTTKVPHKKKRHLGHITRNQVGGDLQGTSCSEYRKKMAKESMDVGDLESPLLYNGAVLRKCKQQKRDEEINAQQGTNVVRNLEKMKHSEPYAGSIHTISADKFFVHYYSPSQLQVYKTHCKSTYSVLALDATGEIVRKVRTPLGRSGNIFLYEGVIRAEGYQIPVVQMLSEKHDANSILYWLNEWVRSGAPVPKEVVLDNSPALKSAVVRAFAGCRDLAEYKKSLFSLLQGHQVTLPCSFVRLDVNHFINAAATWELWKSAETKRLKQFYLHCLGLLIKAETMEAFKQILENILLVSGSPNEGESASGFFNEALNQLTNLIKGCSEIDQGESEECEVNYDDSDADGSCTLIEEFVKDVKKTADEKSSNDGRLNPYYSPDVQKEFVRLGKEFVLWSAVCVSLFKSPYPSPPACPQNTASSATVESDFASLKRDTLRGVCGFLRSDKFVATHLNSIEGSSRIAAAKLRATELQSESSAREEEEVEDAPTEYIPEDQEHVSDSAPKDLRNTENWGGLGILPKRRKKQSLYLNPNPALEVALQNQNMKPPKQRLMKNGNLLPYHELDGGTQVHITNTCPFDVLCQIGAEAYIQYKSWRSSVDAIPSGIYAVSKSLAIHGAVTATYKMRAALLSKVLNVTGAHENMVRCRKRSIIQLVYDCWGTVQDMAEQLMKDFPSATIEWKCDAGCHESNRIPLLPCDADILQEGGVAKLNESVIEAMGMISHEHKCIDDNLVKTFSNQEVVFAPLVFIDIDKFSTYESSEAVFNTIPVKSIPVSLTFAQKTYHLSGLVVRQPPNHFVALCRATNGRWELFNDLIKYPQSIAEEALISPVCAAYVRM